MKTNEKSQREVVHLDLDAFFVSVERLKNSQLLGKPVIIGGGDRGVVAACSYETRAFGVHSAMPMKMALRLCPQAIVVHGDHEDYSKYSRTVTDIIAGQVPLYEKASIDEFYVDMTGMEKFFGTQLFSADLKKTITKETGLPITYALASNKLISKVATNEVKPNGQIVIPFGEERSYLAPLQIEKMPGVGEKTGKQLRLMGIKTIRLLSEIPPEMLEKLFGKFGIDLARKAQGIDESPVIPYREQKGIGTESTFSSDTIDLQFLESQLCSMCEKVAFELRQQGRLTGCITVKIRYSDFNTHTKQAVIPYTAADHVLLQKAKELFYKVYERRQLVRLIGVRFTHLIPGSYQINLFSDTQEQIRLYQQIDSIKSQFGAELIRRASGIIHE